MGKKRRNLAGGQQVRYSGPHRQDTPQVPKLVKKEQPVITGEDNDSKDIDDLSKTASSSPIEAEVITEPAKQEQEETTTPEKIESDSAVSGTQVESELSKEAVVATSLDGEDLSRESKSVDLPQPGPTEQESATLLSIDEAAEAIEAALERGSRDGKTLQLSDSSTSSSTPGFKQGKELVALLTNGLRQLTVNYLIKKKFLKEEVRENESALEKALHQALKDSGAKSRLITIRIMRAVAEHMNKPSTEQSNEDKLYVGMGILLAVYNNITDEYSNSFFKTSRHNCQLFTLVESLLTTTIQEYFKDRTLILDNFLKEGFEGNRSMFLNFAREALLQLELPGDEIKRSINLLLKQCPDPQTTLSFAS